MEGNVYNLIWYSSWQDTPRTSQKNSFPRREQNHDIHDTSSELLIVAERKKGESCMCVEGGGGW